MKLSREQSKPSRCCIEIEPMELVEPRIVLRSIWVWWGPAGLLALCTIATVMGWAAAGRQVALLDWLLVATTSGGLFGVVLWAVASARIWSIRQRHRQWDHDRADVLRFATAVRFAFLGWHLIVLLGFALLLFGVAALFRGLPVSASLVGIATLLGGAIGLSSVYWTRHPDTAVLAFVVPEISCARTGGEAIRELGLRARRQSGLVSAYRNRSWESAREVLALLRYPRAVWPKLENLRGLTPSSQFTWRMSALTGLCAHVILVGVLSLLLAAWTPFNYLPPLTSPLELYEAHLTETSPEELVGDSGANDLELGSGGANDGSSGSGPEAPSSGSTGDGTGSDNGHEPGGISHGTGEGAGDLASNSQMGNQGGSKGDSSSDGGAQNDANSNNDVSDGAQGVSSSPSSDSTQSTNMETESGEGVDSTGRQPGSRDGTGAETDGNSNKPQMEDGTNTNRLPNDDSTDDDLSSRSQSSPADVQGADDASKQEDGTSSGDQPRPGSAENSELPPDSDSEVASSGDSPSPQEPHESDGAMGTEVDFVAPPDSAARIVESEISGPDAPDSVFQSVGSASAVPLPEAESVRSSKHPFAAAPGEAPEGISLPQYDPPENPPTLTQPPLPVQRLPVWVLEWIGRRENQ